VLCKGRLDIGVGIGSPSTIKSRDMKSSASSQTARQIADDHLRAMKQIWTTHRPAQDRL